jgi:hypothetical protein
LGKSFSQRRGVAASGVIKPDETLGNARLVVPGQVQHSGQRLAEGKYWMPTGVHSGLWLHAAECERRRDWADGGVGLGQTRRRRMTSR